MPEAEVRQSLTVAAVPEQVRAARAFVAGVLGDASPLAEVAVLLASELVANSVRHSGSAAVSGPVTVTVTAAAGSGVVRVEVTDRSGGGSPVLLAEDRAGAEGGRGMRLVDMLAARWGFQRGGGQATTWYSRRTDLAGRARRVSFTDLGCTRQ
jgi:anti-sigma regulatory factor (Ser/Thr protein kinase)